MTHMENVGWGMGFGWSFMVLFWVLVVLCIVYIFSLIASRKKGEKKETPMDILQKRYAKGDISREEFERIRDDLTKT